METKLTPERLREILDYDPATGIFTWKERRQRIRVGDVAGNLTSKGYLRIMVDGKDYKAHRLAWVFVKGVWPAKDIDHIDLDKANNRIANLREATRQQNLFNQGVRTNNTTGIKGVGFHRRDGKYRARIRVDGQQRFLGNFPTIPEASAAYAAAAREYHGEFVRLN